MSAPLTAEVVRYRDLSATNGFCQRAGLSLEQVRSLQTHPFARADDAAVVLLLRDGRPVGRYGLIPGRVSIAGTEHALSWGSDWRVDDAQRGSAAAGLLLMRAVREAGTLAACGVSDSARPVYNAARFQRLIMPRQILVIHSAPFWRRRERARVLARSLALPVDVALALSRRLARTRAGRPAGLALALDQVERFDDRLNEIDRAARGAFWFPRDARELNWVLAHPWAARGGTYRYLAFYVRPPGSPTTAGYVLARIRESSGVLVGSLLRFALQRKAAGEAERLLTLIIDTLTDQGVDLVEICTADRDMQRAAVRLGMLRRGLTEIVCKFGSGTQGALRAANGALTDFDADMGEGDVIFA